MIRDYVLFVDTETSGMPKNWNAPYSKSNNWPYNIQIAWFIFDKWGKQIKFENHYIRAKDFHVDPKSTKIHGITEEFLNEKGEERVDVFGLLCNDLTQYQPLIVGHFIEFDNHMMELGFIRSGINNSCISFPKFCTMKATKMYTRSLLHPRLLRLDELYKYLFHKNLEKHHDALCDAKATSECFFEMLRRKDISEQDIDLQIIENTPKEKGKMTPNIRFLSLMVFLIILLIIIALVTFI